MKNFRFRSGIGLAFISLFIFNIGLVAVAVITTNHLLVGLGIVLSCIQFYLHGLFIRRNNILKNYPFRYYFKDILCFVPRKVTELFVTDYENNELSEKERLLLARRSKSIETSIVEDNLLNEHDPGYEYLQTYPVYMGRSPLNLRVEVGTTQCHRPYSLSVFNWGAMDRHTLNKASVHAISQAANMCSCAVNSGEKGLTPELVRGGGDIIWQINYSDLSLRNPDRSFNESLMKTIATKPYVKMIEIRFHPGLDTVHQRALNELAVFTLVSKLRAWSDGKPVGIHLLDPTKEMIDLLARSMISSGIYLDFINIEESQAPNRLLHKVDEQRFFESIFTAKDLFLSYGLQIKVLATGVILTEYDILRLCALGADACFSAASTLMEENTFKQKLIARPGSQSIPLANFQRNTIEATRTLMQRCGYAQLSEADPADFFRRINAFEIASLSEIYCQTERGGLMAQCLHLN